MCYSSKDPLDKLNSSFNSLMKKICQKSGFFVPSPKLISNWAFYEEIALQKRSSGQVEWNTVLTALPKVARQKSGNFSVEVGKTPEIQFLTIYFTQKVSLELEEAIVLTLPKEIG